MLYFPLMSTVFYLGDKNHLHCIAWRYAQQSICLCCFFYISALFLANVFNHLQTFSARCV